MTTRTLVVLGLVGVALVGATAMQARGAADVDARTDVFGFGCVLYEMLSGRKAFQARSSASLLTAIMVSEPPPVKTTSSSWLPKIAATWARARSSASPARRPSG